MKSKAWSYIVIQQVKIESSDITSEIESPDQLTLASSVSFSERLETSTYISGRNRESAFQQLSIIANLSKEIDL